MSNLEIKALQSLEKFRLQKQRCDLQAQKEDYWLVSEIKDWCMEISVYISFIGILVLLAGIFIFLGAGALIFFSIIGLSIYIYIYKKNKKEINRKNQQNWLLQAPLTQRYINHLTDFESIRFPLLIYCIYMVDQQSLTDLEDVSMHCAEHISKQANLHEMIDDEFIRKVKFAKNEYSFGLSQVAEVFYVLVKTKQFNQNIIEDMIQKLFQSFALEQKDFIEREDIHLHQVLTMQY